MTRTVLIVDDEVHIRQGLRVILQRIGTTFGEIHECADGREALSRLTATPVDLVIADIRMPNMDGLTLLREMGSLAHKPHFVFLTGFDDFRYAKLAVRFGACDYLLKPIDTDELKESLLRIEHVIEEEERLRRRISERDDRRHARSSYELGFIMMNDELSADEAAVALEESGMAAMFTRTYETFVVRIKDSPVAGRNRVQPSAWASLLLGNALEAGCDDRVVFTDRDGNVVITGPAGLPGDRLLEIFSAHLGGRPPHAGRSGMMSGIGNIRESYVRARHALRFRFVQSSDGPTAFDEIPYGCPAAPIPVDEVQAVASLVGSNMIQQIKQRLMALFDPDRLNEHPMEYTDALITEVYRCVVVFWTRKFPRTERLADQAYGILECADHFASVRDYLSHLLSFIIEIDTYIISLRAVYKDRNVMDAAVLWINENYADQNLTMGLVARRFGFSYTYFSTAFREHTGDSFVRYLKRLRIERATELMSTQELRLKSVAERVGFPNPRLFARTFREVYGVSPAEYRRNTTGPSDVRRGCEP